MSRLPFELLLALRYLRPKRTFVSVITLISVLGVTLGVAVLIIVISVMSGFDSQLREKVLGFNAHIKIAKINPATGRQGLLDNYAALSAIIKTNPAVKSVSPFAMGQVMIETEPPTGDGFFGAPWARGIEPGANDGLSQMLSNVDGSADLEGHSLLVGTDLAQQMMIRPGDRMAVYTPRDLHRMKQNMGKTNEEAVLPTDYTVKGIFDTGYYEYNSSVVLTSLENFQDLYDLGDAVHGLMVMLKDPLKADEVRAQLETALGRDYRLMTWNEENSAMLAVLVEKNVMLYILFFIVIVAAFGITCTLITYVVLKTREIGVLKALGATRGQVMWIFLSQSLFVSIMGVLVGTGCGMLALAYRNEFLHAMRRLTKLELFPASIYGFTELPALIVPGDILIICGGSLVICLLAAAFPAWHASRLKPVEALRHE